MIRPVLTNDAFLSDVKEAGRHAGTFHIWWLGQSGFLVEWRGRHILLDPYLSDSLAEERAAADEPPLRMSGPVVDPERLDFIDAVIASHDHTGHLDADTLVPLIRVNPGMRLVIPEAIRQTAAGRLGIDPMLPIGLDAGISTRVAGFCVSGMPAAHETLDRSFLGYVVRFGRWAIYHSGDTVLYDGLIERVKRYAVDLALLPIDGAPPARHVPGNLNGREAAALAKEVEAQLVIPCHFDASDSGGDASQEFIQEAERLRQPYRLLRCAERWSYSPERR